MASIPGFSSQPADPKEDPLRLPSSTPTEEFSHSPGAGRPRMLRWADEPVEEIIDPDFQRLLDEAARREEQTLPDMDARIREME